MSLVENILYGLISTDALNPAFDVTPGRLVSGLITERGICESSADGLGGLFPEADKTNG